MKLKMGDAYTSQPFAASGKFIPLGFVCKDLDILGTREALNKQRFLNLLIFLGMMVLLAGCASPATDSANRSAQAKVLLVTVANAPQATLDHLQKSLAKDYQLTLNNNWPLHSIDIYCFIYTLPDVADSDQLIAKIAEDPRVDSAQLIRQFDILSSPETASLTDQAQSYDDQHYPLQLGFKTIQADKAHRWATGKAVKVGIVDTGIDINHSDLSSVSYTRSFVGNQPEMIYPENHGTAIAGIIAASANNAIGIVGIAPDAEIIGLRGCWQPEGTSRGSCNSLSLAKAIDHANVHDIHILNLSLQGPYDPIIERLLNFAIDQNTVVIAAYQPSENIFPASMRRVIAVTSDPQMVDGHSLASTLLAAPGHDILTTIPAGQYDLLNGSSLAAAHISGVVALMREQQPELTPAQIAAGLADAKTLHTSHGLAEHMVNACKAIWTLTGKPQTEKFC